MDWFIELKCITVILHSQKIWKQESDRKVTKKLHRCSPRLSTQDRQQNWLWKYPINIKERTIKIHLLFYTFHSLLKWDTSWGTLKILYSGAKMLYQTSKQQVVCSDCSQSALSLTTYWPIRWQYLCHMTCTDQWDDSIITTVDTWCHVASEVTEALALLVSEQPKCRGVYFICKDLPNLL